MLDYTHLCLGRFQTWPVPLSNHHGWQFTAIQLLDQPTHTQVSLSRSYNGLEVALNVFLDLLLFSKCAPFFDMFLGAGPKNY